ncbi:hypothetical protein GOEFS_022_00030 [Gordonia effusa NBRC 100432]|uniref:SdpI/YhfL family protein n=1 Tax=Gordonia effusa NBRC 100432 TaxID=1077974 RepID=H0QWM2_9ACTN|nr:hypothetical protein GOEFS_022_00030 [Gordonia effusa NBRC 100432]
MGIVSVVSVVVAIIGFALAALWCAVGVAGLSGRLKRNKWIGVRADDTMRSAKAFEVANRVAAPGVLIAAAITAVGAALNLAVGGVWGLVFAIGAAIASLLVIGMVSSLGIRAASSVPVEDDSAGCGSGCCSGGDDEPAAHNTDPAQDCGQSSCGSCALSGLCTNEAAQA